jgi:hypothetical protein
MFDHRAGATWLEPAGAALRHGPVHAMTTALSPQAGRVPGAPADRKTGVMKKLHVLAAAAALVPLTALGTGALSAPARELSSHAQAQSLSPSALPPDARMAPAARSSADDVDEWGRWLSG